MAKVVLKNVTKRFGSLTAVRNVSLEVEDGEFMVLVGPSGCGKTTILRMIAGLEEVTEGEIWIGDRLVNDVPPKDRDIAMVFQNYALYPHMTVYDNIAFGLKLRRVPKPEIDRRVRQAAEMLGIADKLRAKPRELSGGQRQRVAVGRAIVRNPKVFLFDEPLSNLDAKLRVKMRAELQELHHRLKTTTVYVTHDQVEAMTLGHRVAVLNHGVLQQVDTPQRLYDFPANVFVAGFIGSPAMNFLPAKLTEANGQLVAQGSSFRFTIPEAIAPKAEGFLGRDVVVGIRPEHLQPAEPGDDGPDRLTIAVKVVEPLGSELIVYGDLDGVEVGARLDPSLRVQVGDKLTLSPQPTKLHLFDKESERAILHFQELEEKAREGKERVA